MVRHREDLFANHRVRAQFLAQLTPQAGCQRFARFAFTARELPVALEVHTALTLRHEILPLVLDDRGRHDDHARSLSGLNG